MKLQFLAIMLAVCSVSANANEQFGIMDGRLGSAIQDNGNNNNPGTHDRVNQAYNDAKQAINGPMDTHNTSVASEPSKAAVSASAGTWGHSYIDAKNEQTTAPQINTLDGSYVKNDPTGSPVSMVAGVKNDPTGTINVNVSSLKPDALVSTPKGIVKASTLKPGTQVQVAFKSAFHPSVKGGKDGKARNADRSERGSQTGNDNQHDHAMGGHTGAGGGFRY